MSKKYLYIQIGTKARELEAKVLLSAVAAERGYTVAFGYNVGSQLLRLPNGIFLKQLVTQGTARSLQLYASYGHRICAVDEEGLVFPDIEAYKKERLSRDALQVVDKFFAWGNYHATIVKDVMPPEKSDAIISTGHPRLDVLRPEIRGIYRSQADKINSLFGDFILINTNFDLFNHNNGRESFFEILRNSGRINTPEQEQWFWGWSEFRKKMFIEFQDMIKVVSIDNPETTFIIRPHPSENREVWKDFTKDMPNVLIECSGPVVPWLLASKGVIHNGCTTAVEAAVLGKPVLAYRPFICENYDNTLPNDCAYQAFNNNDVSDWIHNKISPGLSNNVMDRESFDHNIISSLTGALAAERMISEMELMHISRPTLKKKLCVINYNLKRTFLNISKRMKIIDNFIVPLNNKKHQEKDLDTKLRKPNISVEEIDSILSDLKSVTGRFKSIKVYEIHCDLFCICQEFNKVRIKLDK